jgi:hypothetical protein
MLKNAVTGVNAIIQIFKSPQGRFLACVGEMRAEQRGSPNPVKSD